MLGTVFDGIARHTEEGYAFGAAPPNGFRDACVSATSPRDHGLEGFGLDPSADG